MREYDLLAIGVNPAMDSYYRAGHIDIGGVNRIEPVRAAPGGKANNFARAYRRLGGCPLTTGIAGGETGLAIVTGLDEEGIGHDYVHSPVESRRTVTIISEAGTTVMLEPGPSIPDSTFQSLAEKVEQLAIGVSTAAICGSLPPSADPSYLADLVDSIKFASSARVAMDTSGEPLRRAALRGVDLIKVNAQEFGETFSVDPSNRDQVDVVVSDLVELGLSTLCITAGARGALIFGYDDCFMVNVQIDRVVSTAGAGDAFLAGLLLGLNRGAPLQEAAKLGAAAAGAATQSIGAGFVEPALVTRMLGSTRMMDADAFFAGAPQ
jgi:1-phosphofructokinase family hexose kinase